MHNACAKSRLHVACLLLVLSSCLFLPNGLKSQTATAQDAPGAKAPLPAAVQAELESLEGALKAAKAAGDAKAEAKTLNQIGAFRNRTSDFQEALDSYNQALTLARTAKDAPLEAAALNGIGDSYREQGQNQKALDSYRQALDRATASVNEEGQATSLNGLGWVSYLSGQNKQALEFHSRALEMARKVGDRGLEATVLRRTGAVYFALGEKKKALDYYSQALPIQRAANDSAGEARTLMSIGSVYDDLGEKQKALDYYNQALPILRQVSDRAGEAWALGHIGIVYFALGEKQKALDYYSQALPILRAVGDRASEAVTLNNIGIAYSALGEKQKALDYYSQALPIYRQVDDLGGEASTMNHIGLVYYSALGEKQKALDYYSQALSIYRQVGDLRGEATTLLYIGSVHYDLGEKQKALEFYNQALTIDRQIGNRGIEAMTLTNIGAVYSDLGEKQKALDFYNQALPIYRQVGDSGSEATTLSNMGNVYAELGEKQKALNYYSQALPIRRQVGDRGGEAMTLNNIGGVYAELGEMQKALDYLSQARSIYRQMGDRGTEAATLQNIGGVYSELGEMQKALETYSQALPIQREAGDRGGEAGTLTSMGYVYSGLGEKQKALEFYNQALTIDRQIGNRGIEAMTLTNIGAVYSDLGEKQKALDYHSQALPIERAVGDRGGEANTLRNIGLVYSDLGEKQKALEYYSQALPLANAVDDPILEAMTFYQLELNQKATQPGPVIFYGKQSVNLMQRVRGNIEGLDKDLQKSFLASNEQIYRDLADLLIKQGRLREALEVLNLLKEHEYSDYSGGSASDEFTTLTGTPAEKQANEQYQKLIAQFASLDDQWTTLQRIISRTPEQEKQYQLTTDQLEQAKKGLSDYFAHLDVLFGANSEASKQTADVGGEVGQLQQTIAKLSNTVGIFTLVTKDRIRLIVITATATKAHEAEIQEPELDAAVSEFGQALRSPMQNPKPPASKLYKLLIDPVREDLQNAGATTIVWSLDGVLRYVPISALYDGKHYLVEKYNSVTITPASIAHLDEKPDVKNLTVAAMGISQQYEQGLPALPAVAGELNRVVRDPLVEGANGVLPGTILLNEQFTEKAMEAQLGGHHAVVHIASHFVFRSGDGSQSYLLLAGKDKQEGGYHLTVSDFRENKDLPLRSTELLTLSACETGVTGKTSDGRDVDGLGMTAQRKGARAVISSLWSVNDASTGQLMGDFYKRWADGAGNVTKVEALRQAQLDLLLGRVKPLGGTEDRGFSQVKRREDALQAGYTHPYYWAPFVLMGNWR